MVCVPSTAVERNASPLGSLIVGSSVPGADDSLMLGASEITFCFSEVTKVTSVGTVGYFGEVVASVELEETEVRSRLTNFPLAVVKLIGVLVGSIDIVDAEKSTGCWVEPFTMDADTKLSSTT